jgi:hypothetical protein
MKHVFVFIMSSILTILSVGCTKENNLDLVFVIPKGFTCGLVHLWTGKEVLSFTL